MNKFEYSPELQEEMWNFGLEDQGRLALNKQEGVKFTIGEISNDVTKATLLINKPNDFRRLITIMESQGETNPFDSFSDLFSFSEQSEQQKETKNVKKPNIRTVEKYIGLIPDENGIVEMNYDIERRIIDEFNSCILTDENIKKFLSDYCKIGRMRQELTIDYAKKKTDLSGITELMFSPINAMGMNPINIYFNTKSGLVVEMPPYKSRKINVADDLYELKKGIVRHVQNKIVGEKSLVKYIESQEPCTDIEQTIDEIKNNPRKPRIFDDIKLYYNDIIGDLINSETAKDNNDMYLDEGYEDMPDSTDHTEYNDTIDRLTNMIRMATKHMSPAERGAHVRAASRNESEVDSKFYLQVCKPEYLHFLISKGYNTVKYIGEELFNEDDSYFEGCKINFVNGQDVNGRAYIERPYTGTLVVFKHTNNKLYAGLPLEEAIKVPEPTGKIIAQIGGQKSAHILKDIFNKLNARQHNRCILYLKTLPGGNKMPHIKIRKLDGSIEEIALFISKDLWCEINNSVCYIRGIELKTVSQTIGNGRYGFGKELYIKLDIIDKIK